MEKMQSQTEQHEEIPLIERLIFANRPLLLCLFLLVTIFLAYHMFQLRPVASFERMIPTYHEFVKNAKKHEDNLPGLNNKIRIVVETTEGDILTKEYMETLQEIHDTVFFLNGVNRMAMQSLWASSVRWLEVTEEGFSGGKVMPEGFTGTPEQISNRPRWTSRSMILTRKPVSPLIIGR